MQKSETKQDTHKNNKTSSLNLLGLLAEQSRVVDCLQVCEVLSDVGCLQSGSCDAFIEAPCHEFFNATHSGCQHALWSVENVWGWH